MRAPGHQQQTEKCVGKIKSKVVDEVQSSFTSMIDIVFLLLIFFILQPFKETELKLDANLPQDGAPNSDPTTEPKVEIKVAIRPVISDPNNAMYVIDGQNVGMASQGAYKKLAGILLRKSNGDKEAPISILPSTDVRFEHVLRVLDACYRVRMGNVKFGFGS